MADPDRELLAIAAGERARHDQSVEGTRDFAGIFVEFRNALIAEATFPAELADDLTREFFLDVLSDGHKDGESDEDGEGEG